MKTISLKIPDGLAAALRALARSRRQTNSQVIREILRESLSDERVARQGSCLALAEDLAGCIAGPGDLSCNKKHMRGYGR